MCRYHEVLGSGEVLPLQALTALAILLSIGFWILVFRRYNVGLGRYAVPITLWAIFGTMDILITAKGTFSDPMREGNQLARLVFMETGYLGPVLASTLWIALWAGLAFAVNRLGMPQAEFVTLSIFYSLASGHFSGFASWFAPMCGLSLHRLFPGLPAAFVFIGISLACVHLAAGRLLKTKGARPG